MFCRSLLAGLPGVVLVAAVAGAAEKAVGPYQQQVAQQLALLASEDGARRAGAAESLGYLRAHAAEEALIARLQDASAEVRRQAAMALGWCGGRKAVAALLLALDDRDWLARQAAHVALTNLTGMEFAFNALAVPEERTSQAQAWRDWWARVPADRAPDEVLQLLEGAAPQGPPVTVAASTTYRGPTDVLVDGQIGPQYWQTKNVPLPQWCEVDLGRPMEVTRVVVHQYGRGYCMTDYELSTSTDGRKFARVLRQREESPVRLEMDFAPHSARFIRITSHGSQKKLYPTTFFEIEIFGPEGTSLLPGPRPTSDSALAWRLERGLRALGALGGAGATERVLAVLGESPSAEKELRPATRAGIRALGRLREEAGFEFLIHLLDSRMWARAAAEALGDFGDARAAPALIAAYPRYAKTLDGKNPPDVPADDNMKFPSEDRMLETPYWIAYALCRLPLNQAEDRHALRRLAPQLMANLPGDHDTFVLYQPEVGHLLTRHLIDAGRARREALEYGFEQLGQARKSPADEKLSWPKLPPARIATWLPALAETQDSPRLLALLHHDDGWVRLNAAKALAWVGDIRAANAVAEILAQAKAEADFGYSSAFKEEEYNDPSPRWREALVRVLGLKGDRRHVPLLARILNDERSVLEVRRAAADALGDLATPDALDALRQAALGHDFLSVRNVARDSLWVRGVAINEQRQDQRPASRPIERAAGNSADQDRQGACAPSGVPCELPAMVFVQGNNILPTTWQTIPPEQADPWRQTYAVTDEGPSYRPGENLLVFEPRQGGGKVRPLTQFRDGYVGEPDVSWDGRTVLFTRREADNQWWQVWQVNVDGSDLKQLTRGPYHHVGPAWLPDGRIVLASSRSGIRDEYHGYPCTALYVMNADGSDLHPIATNIGRDNEPAVLSDGRIVFSRLEVFYSRNKTELTLHAMHPDGTQDVVLYGPERRTFWRALDHGPKGPDDGQESPLTHRVLRITQPQAMPDARNIVVATQGGLTLIGPRRDRETLIMPDYKTRAYTTPWPLPDGSLLCAATEKTLDREQIDLALYRFWPETGRLELIYNDPRKADYEARPIMPRAQPPVLPAQAQRQAYSGRFLCASVFHTQEAEVRSRGRLVRLIEGVPMVGRHLTHTSPQPVWKNHGGTFARVLGTAPLASDGSFFAELPADRLVHLQVLDSDRRVLGNQLTWISVRPGETKSCAGCHEEPHSTPRLSNPLAAHFAPLKMLPSGDEFAYRAKAWFKGTLPAEIEERTRTVHAVNLLGRQ